MLRTTVTVFGISAISVGLVGLMYYYQWFGMDTLINGVFYLFAGYIVPGLAAVAQQVPWLTPLWFLSSVALLALVAMMRFSQLFNKEVSINFPDLDNSRMEDDALAANVDEAEDATTNHEPTVKLIGTYLEPFMLQVVIRPIISIWAALILVTIALLGIHLLGFNTPPPWPTALASAVVAVAVWWPNQKPFYGHTPEQAPAGQPTYRHMHIPDDYVAIVTWLGNRLPIYLTEGDQPWIPTFFGFGINRASLYGAKTRENTPVGEHDGLVYVGIYILPIWNNADERGKITIRNVTRGGSYADSTFLVSFVIRQPLIYAKSFDRILQIADQARAGLRKAFSSFRDIDITSMKSIIATLTQGKPVRVAVTKQAIEHLPEGSVVTDEVGDLFADITTNEPYQNNEQLLEHIRAHGHPRFFANGDRENGAPLFGVKEISLKEKLIPTIRSAGGRIVGTVIGNIILGKTVSDAAQEAEAVGQRRLSTLGLAQAQKEARALLEPAEGETIDDTSRVIALLQSGVPGVKLIHNTGSSSSSNQAAATLGSLLNDGKDSDQ